MEKHKMKMPLSRFAAFCWGVLAYNILVVLFGAYVRATGSGAGCGRHWPLCNGVVIPRPEQVETIIEFTHRLTSGVVLILVAVLVVWAWRLYPKGSLMRKASGTVLFFTITEALVGAGIVLYGWVADDTSVARAISVPIHLANTFLLLGSCTVAAWWATNGVPNRLKPDTGTLVFLLGGVVGMLLLGGSGAITALGDTLFPATSLAEGLKEKFSPTAHFLVRMRIYHPAIAVGVGAYLVLATWWVRRRFNGLMLENLTLALFVLYGVQMVLGLINVALLAPVWMQIIHLLVSCLIWINYALMVTVVFGHLSPGVRHQQVDQLIEAVSRE